MKENYTEGKLHRINEIFSIIVLKAPDTGKLIYNIVQNEKIFDDSYTIIGNAYTLAEALFNALCYFSGYYKKFVEIEKFFEEENAYEFEKKYRKKEVEVTKEFTLKEMEVPEDQYKEFGPYKWSEIYYDKKSKKFDIMTDAICITRKP